MNLHFDLFDLKLFAFVAEARSLTRGADKACISLAAASTRIKQMEEAIGGKLQQADLGPRSADADEALAALGRRCSDIGGASAIHVDHGGSIGRHDLGEIAAWRPDRPPLSGGSPCGRGQDW